MIVLNERVYVEKLLAGGTLSRSVPGDIYKMAKYYNALGFKPAEIRKKLKEFLRLALPLNFTRYEAAIGRIVEKAMDGKLYELDALHITRGEYSRIRELRSLPLRKLAFTLLCLARFGREARGQNDGWVNLSDSEIFKLANVSASRVKHGLMLNELMQAGLIAFPNAVDNTSIRVLFMDDTETAFTVTDMRSLGYQLAKREGRGHYAPCTVCRELVPVVGGKALKVYCPQHKSEQRGNRVATCPDCGKVFVAAPRARTERCPRCYEAYRRNAVAASKARG